jgi:hypothetical protein
MAEADSVEKVLLERLLAGQISLGFVRELYRQRDLLAAREADLRRQHPGAVLAMVADQVLTDASYLDLMARLLGEFPGRPFALSLPDDGHRHA